MYFDMRIGVIRDQRLNCQTIQKSKNMEIPKKPRNKFKKNSKIQPDI
jgi:hypothetical protein